MKQPSQQAFHSSDRSWFKKLRGGILLVLGFLLSPLSWWNDLIFNLPISYGFGLLCSRFAEDWLIGGTIAGYWLSNILGILLMQAGVLDMAQPGATPRNLKKELLTGILSSTVYSLVIVGLLQFHLLETPQFLLDRSLNPLTSFLPW